MITEGESKSMPYEQGLMVIGEALRSAARAAPFTSKALAGKENEEVTWWGDLAHMMIQNKTWNEKIASAIISYSVSNIPMTIDIMDDSTIMVLGGVDGTTEKGRKLIEDIHQKMADGKVTWKDQDGKVIKPASDVKEEKRKKRKAQKQARRRTR